MPKLWLVFKDENGEEKRVEVDRTPFTIGRHSECDLTILDGRLSREHLRIERQMDKFIGADAGSSNGTTLKGKELIGPVGLKNEDTLNLGGGLDIAIELEATEPERPAEPEVSVAGGIGAAATEAPAPALATVAGPAAASQVAGPGGSGDGGVPTAFFILAPLLGVFVLAAVIGAVVLFGGGEKQIASSNSDDYDYSNDNDPTDDDENDTPKPIKSATPAVSGTPLIDGPIVTSSPTSGGTDLPPTGDASENAKVERNGAAFLRQAAQNDQKAFLTTEQAAVVAAVVKRTSRSAALADNINSARRNASAIKSLAASKNLKPQFLAVAAITKLGGSRGDVLQAAQSVVDVYDKLAIQVNNENSDDVLLLVAAYDHGVAGDFMKMRNSLQELAMKPGAPGVREIRSIWFLEKNGKITRAEYERALNFLAIGTIAQNPKEFGVNAEALRL